MSPKLYKFLKLYTVTGCGLKKKGENYDEHIGDRVVVSVEVIERIDLDGLSMFIEAL